ncbi:hypothetical protein HDU67_008931 [Dinochytrium kinnereticum]|nr:hypothetical protein HDU67_008931 [Dinochytrium kinnereticum]
MNHPKVSTAAVILKDKSHLIGYYSPPGLTTEELSSFVSGFLAPFMVPSIFVGLETMPTNVNGKTDKKFLSTLSITVEQQAPSTDAEKKMAEIWASVLKVPIDSISRHSSYFELGGDSLSSIKLLRRIQVEFPGADIGHAIFFKYPILSALSLLAVNAEIPDLSTSKEPSCTGYNIVCLHGQGSNAIHMEHQMSTLRKFLGDKVNFIYIQAPLPVAKSYLSQYYDDMQWFEWMTQNPQGPVVESMLSYVLEKIAAVGRVDGILGFSQGAILVSMLDRMASHGKCDRSWRFSVLCSAVALPSTRLPPSSLGLTPSILRRQQLDVPSIHVWGAKEEPRFHAGLKSQYLPERVMAVQHSGGHDLPKDEASAQALSHAILQIAESAAAVELRESKKKHAVLSKLSRVFKYVQNCMASEKEV